MNNQFYFAAKPPCKIIIIIGILLLISNFSIWGQDSVKHSSKPLNEIFELDDDLIGDALGLGKRTVRDVSPQDTIRIYNQDGSIWYEFSFNENSPLYFRNNERSNFRPFTPPTNSPVSMMLRIKATSENWYEVIINEKTLESKYTFKNDPILGRWSFEKLLLNSGNNSIKFNIRKNYLRNSPNGQIKNIDISDKDTFIARRIEGEWLEVKLQNGINESGWIRWREGRKILIGFIANFWELSDD